MEESSYLCQDRWARRRVVEMDDALQPSRRVIVGAAGLTLVAVAPWVGWWTVPLLVVATAVYAASHAVMRRSARPEWWILAGLLIVETVVGVAVALSGGPDSPAIAWLAMLMVGLPSRFGRRGVRIGVGWAVVTLLAATVAVDPAVLVEAPQKVLVPLVAVLGVTQLSLGLSRAEIRSRIDATMDPLTGLANRGGLLRHFEEYNAQPLAVVLLDIDNFKRVNDDLGHRRGDDVLTGVAEVLRREVRGSDLVHRYGGEEFVVLLPHAAASDAIVVAERLRAAIADARPAGIDVRVSCGVSADSAGASWPVLFDAADKALYRAKELGRDRVVASPLLTA